MDFPFLWQANRSQALYFPLGLTFSSRLNTDTSPAKKIGWFQSLFKLVMKLPLSPLDHFLPWTLLLYPSNMIEDKVSRMSVPGFITRSTLTATAAAFYLAIKHRADIGVNRLRKWPVSYPCPHWWADSVTGHDSAHNLSGSFFTVYIKQNMIHTVKLEWIWNWAVQVHSPLINHLKWVPFFLSTWLYIYPENRCTNLRSVRTKIALLEIISHIELSFTVCIWKQGILLLCGCLNREWI